MSRDLPSSMASGVQQTQVRPVLLYEADFNGTMVRAWTGVGDLSWNGATWTGVGTFAGVSTIEETRELAAKSVSVSLSGVPIANISAVLGSAKQGRTGKIYLGLLDDSGSLVADPYCAFIGRLDVPVIDDSGPAATITITYESRLVALERASGRRYTQEDQQIEYPDDAGFSFVNALQDASITWGTK